MIHATLLAVAVAGGGSHPVAPTAVLVATARGEISIPISAQRGHPAFPVEPLSRLLPLSSAVRNGWAMVEFAGVPFSFLLDAPVLLDGATVVPMAGGAYLSGDTLFIPLQWLTDYIPRRFHEAYRYDPLAARFEEVGLVAVIRSPGRPASSSRRPAPNEFGLRLPHTVVVDAGHGGRDVGNIGLFLPRGINEKHITLAIAKRLEAELERRGIRVVMTRRTDRFVGLRERATMCAAVCDLFVSVHVDALSRTPGYQRANGVHTYFLGEALTAEARRVAAMENDALRYEAGGALTQDDPRLFILKDLQSNEILRESALLANLVQSNAARAHPGRNRGVHQNRFVVLAVSTRPAILIETGYATNRRDAQFLNSPAGQQRLAVAIAEGVVEYLRRYEDKTSSAGGS